ncbi:MAG: TIGR02266 family protein [Acidobacteria bacterium]|nr:TIGR02266 family protein [Acidobacteriota bacterium]MSO62153.1 TIGR02266 family protein [Acidobacteriota bacterium]
MLVAADTPFVRDRFQAALAVAGHRAVVVKSVAQLLARVHADLDELDLIVLDLRMPHASGVELVRRIRKLDQGRLPILVFSGTVTSAEEVRELAALGVGGYLNEYSAVEHILPSIAPHLLPDNFNRRGGPRVVMGIPVSYRAGGTIAAALSLNLSRGGIAIRTSGPLPRDATVKLRFALPGAKRELETEGVVCWSDERAGMGMRFTSVKPADQTAIDEFVNAHFFRSVKT